MFCLTAEIETDKVLVGMFTDYKKGTISWVNRSCMLMSLSWSLWRFCKIYLLLLYVVGTTYPSLQRDVIKAKDCHQTHEQSIKPHWNVRKSHIWSFQVFRCKDFNFHVLNVFFKCINLFIIKRQSSYCHKRSFRQESPLCRILYFCKGLELLRILLLSLFF